LNELLINCLVFADEVICPLTMEPASVLSLVEMQNRMDPVQKDRPELRITAIVPTFYSTQSKEYPGILKELKEEYPNLVPGPIRRTVGFTKASREGKTIFEYLFRQGRKSAWNVQHARPYEGEPERRFRPPAEGREEKSPDMRKRKMTSYNANAEIWEKAMLSADYLHMDKGEAIDEGLRLFCEKYPTIYEQAVERQKLAEALKKARE
jgi:hypothetical protein